MLKKYKITLPDGEEIYVVGTEEPDISAECKTIITVEDEEYEFDGEYDEGDVKVEEIPMDFNEVQYQRRQVLKKFATKEFNIKHTITFKSDTLKALIEQNIDFSYEATTRYNIYGIHFNFQENNVDVVAANGNALSFVTIPNIYSFIGEFTIPLPVVYEMLDYINTNQDIVDITLSFDEGFSQINFGDENYFILIKTGFLDYNKYTTNIPSMCAKIPTKEFGNLLEKCQNQESVLLKFSNNVLHMNEDKINCDFQESVEMRLYLLNLISIMKQINGSEFLLKTNGYRKPVCIQEVDNANKLYIIQAQYI